MSRTVILLVLAQAVAVLCGFFGLEIILQYHGYPGEQSFLGSTFVIYHWSHLALFLRHLGLLLLAIPLAWAVLAGISERRARFILPFGFWLALGTVFPFAIIGIFFYVIFNPYIAVIN